MKSKVIDFLFYKICYLVRRNHNQATPAGLNQFAVRKCIFLNFELELKEYSLFSY